MKRLIPGLTSALFYSFILVAAATTIVAQDGTPSNEIRCRGGGNLIFTTEHAKTDSTGSAIYIELLTFEPAPVAAGPNGAGLKPGQCSWVNRPMNRGGLIRFETPANAQLKQKLHGSAVDTSPTAAERYPDARSIPAYMRDPDHYWSFTIAKILNNFFEATGHQHWKTTSTGGRVKPPGATPNPPRPICAVALEARARNSPAAPGLEGQCRALINSFAARGEAIANQDPTAVELRNQQPDGSARRGFDIGMAAAEGQTAPGPGKQSIHDSLPAAEQAGYTAAVSFSLARNKNLEGDRNTELAAKGEAIANEDPLAVELRNQQPEGRARNGFDIGMAAAEGQTAPGPGKDRIRDSLTLSGQIGFNAAVAFSLERNKYAARAAKGAEIAAADPVVAEARNSEVDVFYRLGFDIATAIFGDPAQGAQGNTATGPGSLGIRDSLSAAGQRGFNASVKLHLSRNYQP